MPSQVPPSQPELSGVHNLSHNLRTCPEVPHVAPQLFTLSTASTGVHDHGILKKGKARVPTGLNKKMGECILSTTAPEHNPAKYKRVQTELAATRIRIRTAERKLLPPGVPARVRYEQIAAWFGLMAERVGESDVPLAGSFSPSASLMHGWARAYLARAALLACADSAQHIAHIYIAGLKSLVQVTYWRILRQYVAALRSASPRPGLVPPSENLTRRRIPTAKPNAPATSVGSSNHA